MYLLSEAFLAGTALDEDRIAQPLRPVFGGVEAISAVPSAAIVFN